MNPNIKKEKWTEEEDERLLELVGLHGNAWAEISRQLEGRTDQQCMGRWRRHLDPVIKRESWAAPEDAALTSLHARHGSQWSAIAKSINGRTAQQCRARCAASFLSFSLQLISSVPFIFRPPLPLDHS